MISGWGMFPGGEKRGNAEEALDFATKLEVELRAKYERAKAERHKLERQPPSYFNDFQLRLALQDLDEEIGQLSISLLSAERKLAWEKAKKWKNK
jgi:hypothetical protein